MRIVRALSVATLLAVAGGCYHYVPTEPSSIPRGTKVQAILTDEGVEEMTRIFGPGTLELEGPLASWSPEGLGILHEVTMHRAGFMPTTLTDTLFLQPSYVAGLGVQELDTKKTAIVTLLTVGLGGATLLASKIFGGTQDGPDEGDGGPPPDDLFFIRIPIGW